MEGIYATESQARAAARQSVDVGLGWIADIDVTYPGGRHIRWIYNVGPR